MPRPNRPQRPKSEYEQKLIDLRRVARVVAGGRRFTFRAALVIGNLKGDVGFGLGKAADTSQSIEKALRDAKKHMISVPLTENGSIPHEVSAKYASARVILKPSRVGKEKGLVAGGAPRVVLALAGVKNASAKILSHGKNKINNARATMEAIRSLKTKK
ncbi:30S ribosomal protein S5 [Candidatus Giovannonibacteria bacterium RIFCSPHIGHO2_01_FULL_45_33]|uniref:Small ribosomal subunit protein uS5 n=1 Tax=Candidatus Giovannonibacteria bacterium RIFCSPLOWO2_01_FULL_45_34 TaxID=1798351 RepID=A0A1F5X054_9BACT|nr:MAG: 30S ribosomal protein S5 [Candidatus Giovannonibacteria bacterium RIFCSPHIGHO2_01_FULL_45_33]OGF69312.1 MAG: 30S ribosomal protein S5 [Candidatus Giovannonibacteria bacterium RIFCSPHIGHO2_02_FULL_44_11]OGF81272.1 MAG: 30S ribosomal protein S5 [Candidatus Giovannonibacteria bacterium RIFCSPLOWO2_01_FULL_45_34]